MNLNWRIGTALNHLAAFEVAVDKGSFTKAAESLGTTQPSVSRHIASLEHILNVPLFNRLHHRVELTDAGQELYDAVKLGLGHIRQTANKITTKQPSNVLTIGCTYGFAYLWLMQRFSALQKLIPEYELRMITSDTETIFDLEEIDFAVRFGKGDWSDGHSQKLFGEELFPVCSPQFYRDHFSRCDNITPSMLADVTLIHEQEEKYSWLSWTQWLKHFSVDYTPAPETYYYNNYALALQTAVEGHGVALAWPQLAEHPLKSGQLVELTGLRVRTDYGYDLAYQRHHPQADMIVNWVKEEAKAQGYNAG
ncbi:MAG: LysR substrate-binding domain-containing protein [Halopseudomonas aestusnigri]